MFNGIGTTEVIIIAIFVLVFFGAKRIPELARGLGQGIKEFRQASKDIKKEISTDLKFTRDKIINKLDLVTRKEFEVLKKIVQKQDMQIQKMQKRKKSKR